MPKGKDQHTQKGQVTHHILHSRVKCSRAGILFSLDNFKPALCPILGILVHFRH
jgi:hypothetical protein